MSYLWLGSLASYLFAWGSYIESHPMHLGALLLSTTGLLFHAAVIALIVPDNASPQDGYFDQEVE